MAKDPTGSLGPLRWGLAYMVGLGLIVTGFVIAMSRDLLGEVLFMALQEFLTLLGAPEDRAFLPPSEPEAGGEILEFFGGIILACGGFIVFVRVILDLLGFTDGGGSTGLRRLTDKLGISGGLGLVDKLGLAAFAAGFLVFVSAGLPELILYEIFLYDYRQGTMMSILGSVSRVGGLIMYFAMITLLIAGPERRRVLYGWTYKPLFYDVWGFNVYGWLVRIGLGVFVIGIGLVTTVSGYVDFFIFNLGNEIGVFGLILVALGLSARPIIVRYIAPIILWPFYRFGIIYWVDDKLFRLFPGFYRRFGRLIILDTIDTFVAYLFKVSIICIAIWDFFLE